MWLQCLDSQSAFLFSGQCECDIRRSSIVSGCLMNGISLAFWWNSLRLLETIQDGPRVEGKECSQPLSTGGLLKFPLFTIISRSAFYFQLPLSSSFSLLSSCFFSSYQWNMSLKSLEKYEPLKIAYIP